MIVSMKFVLSQIDSNRTLDEWEKAAGDAYSNFGQVSQAIIDKTGAKGPAAIHAVSPDIMKAKVIEDNTDFPHEDGIYDFFIDEKTYRLQAIKSSKAHHV